MTAKGIGPVPENLGTELEQFLNQVRLRLIDIQAGRVAALLGGGTGGVSGPSAPGPVGPPGMPGPPGAPEPYVPDLTPPPTPSGVVVSAGLDFVFITTDAPTFSMGHGYNRTLVYGAKYQGAGPQPTFSDAVLVHEFVGQVGSFGSEPAAQWHIWVKWRSNDGVLSISPEGGANGHVVTTGVDVSQLLEALSGSIRASELQAALSTRIDLIDAPSGTAGSVNARILTVQSRIDNGNAAPFEPALTWDFQATTDGWTFAGLSATTTSDAIVLDSTGIDPIARSPFISISGETYDKIRARVRRDAGSGWDGGVYYLAGAHGENEGFHKRIPDTTVLGQWVILEWDMAALTAGGSDWISNSITGIRIDLGTTAADTFSVDWISVGRRGSGANYATVQQEITARAAADVALASSISTVQATAASNTAAIATEATARATVDGHLSALYSVRVQLTEGGRTVMGGFGIMGTSGDTAGPQIDAGFVTNRFYIGAPPGSTGISDIVPFIVQATPTTINGVAVPAGVYMDTAFIRNGTITNALIGNASITDAKIVSLSATKITAGTIAVGEYIQSSDYVNGVSGWRIGGNMAEFGFANIRGTITAGQISASFITTAMLGANQVTAAKISVTSLDAVSATIGLLRTASSGARQEIASNYIKIYDAANVKRVQLGDLTA